MHSHLETYHLNLKGKFSYQSISLDGFFYSERKLAHVLAEIIISV